MPGRKKPIRIMSEDFTLYRGHGGEPHILDFRCAHRGTQLTAGWVEGDNLRCFYHGWLYDPDGRCLEQPGEAEPFCQKISIRSVPTQEYVGVIFGYFGEGPPPPLPRFAELENSDALLENWYEEWPCNYFNRLENAPDIVHVNFVHKQIARGVPKRIEAKETEYGFMTRGIFDDGRPEGPGTRFHMPNMNYFVSPAKDRELETGGRAAFMWRVPVDDENHLVFGAQRVQVRPGAIEEYLERRRRAEEEQQRVPMAELAEAVLAGKMEADELIEARWWDINSVQDFITLVGQGVIADREREHLGREDAGVILLRKLYVRELRALAGGRPVKQWRRTEVMDLVGQADRASRG